MPANRAPGRDRPHVRLKLKFPAYVVTHRMLTGLTATRVWEIVAVTDALRRGLCRRQAATGRCDTCHQLSRQYGHGGLSNIYLVYAV